MIAQYLDLTEQYNTSVDGTVVIELSNYDYCLFQVIGNEGEFHTLSTIDSGAIEGVTDGNWLISTNYSQIAYIDLASGNYSTTNILDGIFKVPVVGRYLKLANQSGTIHVNKLLVMLAKIS